MGRAPEPGAQTPGVVLVLVDELRYGGALDVGREVVLAFRVLLDVVVLHLGPRPKQSNFIEKT